MGDKRSDNPFRLLSSFPSCCVAMGAKKTLRVNTVRREVFRVRVTTSVLI